MRTALIICIHIQNLIFIDVHIHVHPIFRWDSTHVNGTSLRGLSKKSALVDFQHSGSALRNGGDQV